MLITSWCIGQKIQIKKDVLLKDGEPIALLEGKAGTGNATMLVIKSLQGQPLMRVRSRYVNYKNNFYKGFIYHALEFLSLDKSAAILTEYTYSSERKLIEYLYTTIGADFLGKDGLQAQPVTRFVDEQDQSKKIHADTTRIMNILKLERERLDIPPAARNAQLPFVLRSLGLRTSGNLTAETFEIYQDNLLLGKVTKFISSQTPTPGATTIRSASYEFQRKIQQFEVEGELFDYGNLGSIEANPNYPLSVKMYCGRASLGDIKLTDILNGEHEIVAWLIERTCL
jgi:hypothetical protein